MRKYNSLIEILPSLVKEWHPSENGNLNPRNLEVVYPKKVWWICSEGHEWQATIKSRRIQKDCPICESEGSDKKTDESLSIFMSGKNRRNYKRFNTSALAVVKMPNSGHLAYVEIKDFSHKGLCIETDFVIRPGSAIKLKFDKVQLTSKPTNSRKSFNTDTFKTYNSTVKWYRRFGDERSDSIVKMGLKFK
jgi:hypothetical protein